MIQGSIVAIVTPMRANGAVDFDALDRLIEWHVESGTNGIVAVGTTGESPTLTVEEHLEVIKYCITRAGGRIPVLAGTGSNSTAEAISFSAESAANGADACLLVTPYYNKPSQEGLYQHFRAIAEAVDIPHVLYNVPGRTACTLELETTRRLAAIPNIVGIKEATGKVETGLRLIEEFGDSFAVYGGDDNIALALMLRGGRGTVSVTANVAPALMSRICRAALEGNEEEAKTLNERLMPLHANLFLEANPVPVKWALREMGMIESGIRLPLVELNYAYHDKVRQALRFAGIELTSAGAVAG
ncbi:MAG: 4-hydroxy-tetrahydrodipicolinate synthase [Pseudohongiellaceae bacterium]